MRSLWFGVLVCAAMFVACGDDDSDFAARPSDDSSSSVCEDCDDESSSSVTPKSSDSETSVSSSSTKSSSSSVKSSSSTKSSSSAMSSSSVTQQSSSSSWQPPEILEPEITVNETCEDVGACDAMVKTDVSTWHFVRKDDFGDDAEYTYTADGRDLIVTIKNADGSTDSKTYSMYNMESEVGVEMAFNAAKSTCMDGGGNDNKEKSCVKDTTFALPECDTNREGVIGIDTTGIKVICRENEWLIDVEYGSLTDDRDDQTYKTVRIGDQWWMAENLNFETDNSFCYNDDASNCTEYGRLYTWTAAMDSAGTWSANGKGCGYDKTGSHKTCSPTYPVRGVCPDGWHLPSNTEFETLFKAVGGVQVENTKWRGAGGALKSTSGWNKPLNSWKGTDDFGFSVFPAGVRDEGGDYYSKGNYADFWSSTEFAGSYAYKMMLRYDEVNVSLYHDTKSYAYSVRCLKD